LKSTKFAGALLLLLICGGAAQSAAKPWVRDFCIKDDQVEYADRVGTFEMQARLVVTGSHYVLKAWNVMPDISQILSFEADGAYRPKGPTRIRFIDNFENRGTGTFEVRGSMLVLNLEPPSIDDDRGYRNIRRNYGEHKLPSAHCKWQDPF
jgi:hypothetical protein